MCATCGNRPHTVVETFPESLPRANDRAEWKAGEVRDQQPETHVHFNLDRDAFVVVTPQPEIDDEMEIGL